MRRVAFILALAIAAFGARSASAETWRRLDGRTMSPAQIDAEVERLRVTGKVPGVAVALIREGRVVHLTASGLRDVQSKAPLTTDTVMYGASLTKLAFAYMVMQLADEGRVGLDASIAEDLPKPLTDYPKYADLKGDERWRRLTPRILLLHASGFANFRFLEPDEKLRFHFEPGARYAYSGEGINLLQFGLEADRRLDVGREMKARVFEPLGMTRTSMTWRDDFSANLATGYLADGSASPHDQRESVRAAGSMDTTIADYAKFLAAMQSGRGLSARSRAEMTRPQLPIVSAHQFPTLDEARGGYDRTHKLAAGLGLVVFEGRYGKAFMKGGHDDQTDNMALCVEARRTCILMMSNSGVGARIYPALAAALLGETGAPWDWEYNPRLPLAPPAEAR